MGYSWRAGVKAVAYRRIICADQIYSILLWHRHWHIGGRLYKPPSTAWASIGKRRSFWVKAEMHNLRPTKPSSRTLRTHTVAAVPERGVEPQIIQIQPTSLL